MRLFGLFYLPLTFVSKLVNKSKGYVRLSSPPSLPGSILVVFSVIFFMSMVLISNMSNFNYQRYQSLEENLRYYMKLDRTFFKLPVFASQHSSSNTLKAKPDLLDPRVPINAYMNELVSFYSTKAHVANKENPTMNFDWADWVDLSQADLFIESHKDLLKYAEGNEDKIKEILTKFCYDEMADKKDPWVEDDLHEKHLYFDEQLKSIGICSAIWKKYYFQNPERLIFSTDKQYFEIDVKERKSDLQQVIQKHHVSHPTRKDNQELASKLLDIYSKNGGELKDLTLKKSKSVPKESFIWEPRKDLEELIEKEKNKELSESDAKYKDFLQYAKDHAVQPHFYFTFPGLKVDRNAELHHYNFPFIRQIISHEERIAVIHHLMRAWQKLCESYGIVTWINYGNLIGWWFNAQNLPWDNDIDVQVSIRDLNKIGRYLNNSLIVENPKDGNGLFWLQTDHVYSEQGSGNNFIDARFIDARTGIYIDISALWHTEHDLPEYMADVKDKWKDDLDHKLPVHCKHLQFFTLDDLFPLRRTIYEGAQVYIPNKVERILKRFYGDRPFKSFKCFDHNYQADIGLWVPDEICADPPMDVSNRFNERGDLTLQGACGNSDLQDLFNRGKDAIQLHWYEFKVFMDKNSDKDMQDFSKEELPVFRDDPFEAYITASEKHGTRNWEL